MKTQKPKCKYGDKCYRQNPQHFREYSHGLQSESEDDDNDGVRQDDETVTSGKRRHRGDSDDGVQQPQQEAISSSKRTRVDEYFMKKAVTANVSTTTIETTDDAGPSTAGDEPVVPAVEYLSALPGAAENVDEPVSDHDDIKRKFLVEMPQDFYDFWEFAKTVDAHSPSDAFLPSLGLELVGPYDVLAGKTRRSVGRCPNYLCHWRYYFDPPEFLTVLRGDDTKQFHMGYYRDDPKEMPVFVASNEAAGGCTIKPRGDNIFAAICWLMEEKLKKDRSSSLSTLVTRLKLAADMKGYSLEQRTARMKERDKKVVAKCFHGAGIVVPVDKNGVGYRPLPETPGSLRKMLKLITESKTTEQRDKHFDALTEIVTLVQFANDECDYGEGLELGLDVFCYGSVELHSTVLNLLPLAYQLLGRSQFADIIKAHVADRRETVASLSQLN